jgi:surface carbohydrate biosynthesis protein (TIGR04326 family)
MQETQGTLLLWDLETEIDQPLPYTNIILWRSYADNNEISIPQLIENNREDYRRRFTEWVYEMGMIKVNTKTVLEILQIRPGFSYWWMTSFVEMQHYSNDSEIYNLFKLMALSDIMELFEKIEKIRFVTNRHSLLISVIGEYAKKKGIRFEVDLNPVKNITKVHFIAKMIKCLPSSLAAILFLVKYILQRAVIGIGVARERVQVSDFSFYGYLLNLPSEPGRKDRFNSIYWTRLVDILERSKAKVLWFHFWVHSDVPGSVGLKQANEKLTDYNKTFNHLHELINSQLDAKTIISVVKDYFKLRTKYKIIKSLNQEFEIENCRFNFWMLFEKDFAKDFMGLNAISNSILLNSFEKIFSVSGYQANGFYLFENATWEPAFIYAWKKAGNGNLIGVSHATIRYWDIRYFMDYRSYSVNQLSKPRPNFFAVNSDSAYSSLIDNGYLPAEILKTEALRYLYLNKFKEKLKQKQPQNIGKELRILILGDYNWIDTKKVIDFFKIAIKKCSFPVNVVYKPHPGTSNLISEHEMENIYTSIKPLSELFQECDLVITTNVTSSVLDAVCAGLYTTSLKLTDQFNMSPMTGVLNFPFFKNADELEKIIKSAHSNFFDSISYPNKINNYFYLDDELPMWNKLLQN